MASGYIFNHVAVDPVGSGTVTSVSVVSANGVSGAVATPTTTPAITLTLGAITPSSVASTGAVTGTNLVSVTDVVSLTNQTADIASTNLTNSDTVGLHRLSFILECTTADAAAGTVVLHLAWTDAAGSATYANSQSTETGTVILSAAGRLSGTILAQVASGHIAYSVTHTGSYGTAVYRLYIVSELIPS